jgi:general stress protein 26
MDSQEIYQASLNLANRSTIAMLGSNTENGYPNIKAMIKKENEGLKTIWFSTNTSSKRVQQLTKNPRTCVYFVDHATWEGLMLVGDIEVLQDVESRKRLWQESDEKYYPLGVIDDPDYTVLRFTACSCNYYHGLANLTFEP